MLGQRIIDQVIEATIRFGFNLRSRAPVPALLAEAHLG
jgi:hypothetical protein